MVTDFRAALPEADIYVYDNNSSDNTAELALAAGAIVRYEHRQGKGNVIRSMFREIDADCYLMADGDDTYPAEYARAMADAVLTGGADMAIGNRLSTTYFTENKRPFHNSGNLMVRRLVNFFFKGSITDIMTGYRAFSPLFVKSFPALSKGFEIETEMTIHALDKNFHTVDVPVDYRDRPEGSVSKLNTVSDGAKVIKTIFRLFKDYKPLLFFGSIGGLLILLALIFFVSVFIGYVETGLVERFPTLIVSGFSALAGMMSFVCGLVLDTEGKNARQQFEIQLNIIEKLFKSNE